MMKTLLPALAVGLLAASCPIAWADEAKLAFGGDQFAAGQVTSIATPVQHDAFAIGNDVTLSGAVSGDAHLAGYDVDVDADVSGDVYAAGFSVSVTGAVGSDLTAAANTITVKETAPVSGNVRLAGATVTLGAPVAGSALVTAQTFTLDAVVSGDFSFYGENLVFGPGARVDGTVEIRAPKEVAVPGTVASADRVRFELLDSPDYVSEAGKAAGSVFGRFWPVFWTVAAWWLVLVLVGAGLIALLPKSVGALQAAAERRPFRNLGLGLLAFAAVLGLVPVMAMTVVGILLLPFVVIFAVVACSLAFVGGAFLIGVRIASAFIGVDTNLKRLGVLAISLVAAALLGMTPFLGWFITLLILIFGFGAATVAVIGHWAARDARRLSGPIGAVVTGE
jgi:cytoskeletal protein CcmA (bactofilin family)